MSFPLTQEQRAAVEDRGGELLVSAAAGSGKTRVLVERLLARVEDEGADMDRFLVITYTNAAAAELRDRVAEELNKRLGEHPTDRHLRRQALLVYKAQISTIHAFCGQFLRESGHLLDLDPDFRLCDEAEAGVLMARAMDEVLDKRYEDMDPQGKFAQLLEIMSTGRDDSRVARIALDIYARTRSHPRPRAWLEGQKKAFDLEGVTDVSETVWGRALLDQAGRQARYWQAKMERLTALALKDDSLTEAYLSSLQVTAEDLGELAAAAEEGWDRAAQRAEIRFPKLGSARNCIEVEARDQIKSNREKCKRSMDKLAELFTDDSAQLLEDMALVRPAVEGLVDLVEDFSDAYDALKREKNLMDFSDLEHMAAALLVGEDGSPTDLAREWSRRFIEVMVDEYQDTNQIQNAIFNAVSDEGRKLFQVGDVKQSIYRFRLADPTIFLNKYRAFSPAGQAKKGEPRSCVLTRNFRSRATVLEGVNYLFRAIMSKDMGEMEYTDDQALWPGGEFPGGEEVYRVELDVLDLSRAGEEGEEKIPRDLLEARFIARRVKELLEGGLQITDKGGLRRAEPGDIAILLRSPGTVLHHYIQALGELDLPWEADGGGDFLASTEVSIALSYLQIIDNPRQDVPLVSVLRSPIYGYTPDRLAQVRALDKEGDLYTALSKDTAPDSAAFLAALEGLRDRAGDVSCHQLLWEVYDATDLPGICGALGDGETRRGNLMALAEYARAFEAAGHRGLFGFLTYLERLRENGERLARPAPAAEGRGVRIMSIHRSKGLEFPVVILGGLVRRLNREDMQKPMLFHSQLGVGPKGLDRARMVEYPTLARRAVAARLEGEMMAEELRLLYVAMTRAKEKLVMVCALTRGEKELQRLCPDADCPVDAQALLASQSTGQWVLMAALTRPDGEELRQAAGTWVYVTAEDCGPRWDIRWIDGADLAAQPVRHRRQKGEKAGSGTADPVLAERLRWVYPHAGDVDIPSKLTATQLKGRHLDQEAEEEAPRAPRPARFGRPRFAAEEMGLTAAQKGTALHLVMQFIDFDKAGTADGVRAEIGRLADKDIITLQQAQAVAPEKIAAFFQSELGREMTASGKLQREFKFSLLVPAGEYYPQAGPEEKVLLQGVVDCWFETAEGITVVDFKTDRVGEDTVQARAEEYRPQLGAYARALEEVTGKPVRRRVLWFFALDRAVEVPG